MQKIAYSHVLIESLQFVKITFTCKKIKTKKKQKKSKCKTFFDNVI